MKHLKKIDEVLRTKGMSKEEEAEAEFEEAYTNGTSSPNIYYLDNDWEKVSSKYHLYDNYYLYKDAILSFSSRESSSWYSSELKRLKDETHVFKQRIYDRIKKLEDAFNKL